MLKKSSPKSESDLPKIGLLITYINAMVISEKITI